MRSLLPRCKIDEMRLQIGEGFLRAAKLQASGAHSVNGMSFI